MQGDHSRRGTSAADKVGVLLLPSDEAGGTRGGAAGRTAESHRHRGPGPAEASDDRRALEETSHRHEGRRSPTWFDDRVHPGAEAFAY